MKSRQVDSGDSADLIKEIGLGNDFGYCLPADYNMKQKALPTLLFMCTFTQFTKNYLIIKIIICRMKYFTHFTWEITIIAYD